MNETKIKLSKRIIGGIGIVILTLFINPITLVDAGYIGLVLHFGAVTDQVFEPGIHVIIPLVQSVQKVDVRIRKTETSALSASKDLQTVSSVIALNYHISKSEIGRMYNEIGMDVEDKIIGPAIQEVIKSTTATYTAEELITKRSLVSQQIQGAISDRLKKYNLLIDDFSIKNFDFSQEFNRAIEAKQTA